MSESMNAASLNLDGVVKMLGEGPTKIVDPQVMIDRETDCGDHFRSRVSYWVDEDDRGYAWLLQPKKKGKFPLVLCPHQTKVFGKDGPVGLADEPQYHYALDLVRQGFVCFAPDEFCAGERLKPSQKAYDTSEFYQRWPEWSAVGKSLWDLQRAVDFLVTLNFIDADRIGEIGHSLGGHSSLLLAAFDSRVKAAVVCTGVPILRTEPRRWEYSRTDPAEYIYYPRLRPYLDHPETLPFDYDEIAKMIAPRSLLMILPLNDEYTPGNAGWLEASRGISEYYAKKNHPENFATYFHNQGHCFPPEAREMAYEWLMKHLTASLV
jgi:cephalosporin-C deacetylase-like acetyl esterase